METPGTSERRIYFIANGISADQIAGGDIHYFHMAKAAIDAGYIVHFFGGHACEKQLRARFQKFELTLTDKSQSPPFEANSLTGQLRLFCDYFRRLAGSLRQLKKIQRDDLVYSATDYWFDSLPMMLSRAKSKLMILGMDAPTIREIIFRSRPDVPAIRVNSIYYWLSQNMSLFLFRFCKKKRLFYVHPNMKPRLLGMGYKETEIIFISNGFDLEMADQVPEQTREFDVAWIGRVHRQKGIEDLLETLIFLSKRLKDFRAVLIGRLEELKPKLAELGLDKTVTLAGMVSEEEKFRLLKKSRAFLMPSRQESWGIVIGEALSCGAIVVAYELEAYRPIFRDLLFYVPQFDFEIFKQTSLTAVERARVNQLSYNIEELARFRAEHSWEAAGKRFLKGAESLRPLQ